jgi:type IV pilus assembly protein PilV
MNINIYHLKIKQTGSVLLEAMIAILIFSIGILAMVGMQATAINNVSDSKYRSTASFLADQIVGTMWSQRVVTFDTISNVYVASADTTFQCNPCTSANGNPYTKAWLVNGVLANLPQQTTTPAPSITMGNSPAGVGAASQVTVTINWQSPKDAVPHKLVVNTYIN